MDLLNPPWIQFPDIPWGSTGWRMGFAEKYWKEWTQWYAALSDVQRTSFKQRWPEPHGWIGVYHFIERGVWPQWAQERRRMLAEPHAIPDAEEQEITDYYRVVWLLRNHLKPETYPYGVHGEQKSARQDEDRVEFHVEPSGSIWRLGYLTMGGLRLNRAQVDA